MNSTLPTAVKIHIQKDWVYFEVFTTEIHGLQVNDQTFPAHPCHGNREATRIPQAFQKSNAICWTQRVASKENKCINPVEDTTNLIRVTLQKLKVGLQITKSYHHPLTLLGTATAVLNESQVYVRHTKGRGQVKNTTLIGWSPKTVYTWARRGNGAFLFQLSSPKLSLSLSFSHIILVYEYYLSTMRSNRKQHVECKEMEL